MIRLALLRHGHTAWNRAGRIQGRSDIPLDDTARAHLAGLALPDPWGDAALWSSPLVRAVETARMVAGRAPLQTEALTEMNWGDWEGETRQVLFDTPGTDYRNIEDWRWDYTPPGGESPADIRARLVPWVGALKEDAVAVCHIGVMRVLLGLATGWEFDGPAPFSVKRDRLYVIEIEGNSWTLTPKPQRLVARPKCG